MKTVDEEFFTVNLPKRLARSVIVDSEALAVHFTFGNQGNVEQTDLFSRYRAYAIEKACLRKL